MGDVVILPVVTKLDVPVERILTSAIEADLGEVVVIGFDKDGDFYFAANKSDGGGILWLMEIARKKLLEVGGH